ncbi:hypothetical protein PO002_45275, partial [Cupriavidus necator]
PHAPVPPPNAPCIAQIARSRSSLFMNCAKKFIVWHVYDTVRLGINGFNSGSGTSAVINVQPGKDQVGAVVGVRHRF